VRRDIIVMGASAGGVEALRTIVSLLPSNLPAAVFIVLHIHRSITNLPEILQRAGPLSVSQADDGMPIDPGRIYVAPPDHHLIVQPGHMHLSKGPRENRSRPAANPLFRSAALAYGPRVIGVVLTGLLDDGTAGLWEIKRRGGLAVVQDPQDAAFPQMPQSTLASVPVDYIANLHDISALLVSICGGDVASHYREPELAMAAAPTKFTCPDCYGPIERIDNGSGQEYRCRVGHSYSPRAILDAHADAEERSLWTAVQNLEESADLAYEVSRSLSAEEAKPWLSKVQEKRALATSLREWMVHTDKAMAKV
jgi:two-component system, chemotaxis family, protein-glutamate methylesterase/glutaminase